MTAAAGRARRVSRTALVSIALTVSLAIAGCADGQRSAGPTGATFQDGSASVDTALPGDASMELTALHARCVDAMVRNACAAKEGSGTGTVAAESSPVVMIAGVGAVDARFYGALRDAGDQMCGRIVQPCSDAWDGSACRTARALWPMPAGPRSVAAARYPIRR